MSELRSERIYLRPAASGDEQIIYQWENDPGLWSFSDEPGPVSMEEIVDFLREPYNDIYTRKQLRLMICTKDMDQIIGAVDLYQFNETQRRCGVGINISAEHRNRGYASEAISTVIRYARDTLKLGQLWCTIPVSNHASTRLFTGLGFSKSGLLHEWMQNSDGSPQDVIIMQYIIR